jgi:hypothetical protein
MRYADAILADGPVSWWRLDEASGTTAADQIGANPGTYTGGFTLGQPGALAQSGDADASVLLNGTTGYVSVPFSSALNTSVFTWEAWVKFGTVSGQQAIISTTSEPSVNVFDGITWNLDGSGNYAANINTGGPSGTFLYLGVTGGFVVGNWYHLAFTWNSSNGSYQGWVNGASTASGTQTVAGFAANTTGLMGIGENGSFAPPANTLSGNMAQAAVYNYALSTAQVAAHYNAGVGLPGRLGAPARMPLGA